MGISQGMSLQHNRTPNRPGKLVRAILRNMGAGLFHMGCAPIVIRLTPDRTRALLYHAVEDQPSSYTRGLGVNVTPQVFGTHLDYFKRYYNVVSMRDLLRGDKGACSLVITFDDGYASVEQNAVPLLEQHDLPRYCLFDWTRGDGRNGLGESPESGFERLSNRVATGIFNLSGSG